MSFPDWSTKQSSEQKKKMLSVLRHLLEEKLLQCSKIESNDTIIQQILRIRSEIGTGFGKYTAALDYYGNYLEEEQIETSSPQGFDFGKQGWGRFIEMQILNLRLSTGVNSVTDALILSNAYFNSINARYNLPTQEYFRGEDIIGNKLLSRMGRNFVNNGLQVDEAGTLTDLEIKNMEKFQKNWRNQLIEVNEVDRKYYESISEDSADWWHLMQHYDEIDGTRKK